LTVYGKGTQTRSFLYIDDLVRGILRLVETDHHLPVNVGSPYEMTVLHFANIILELTDTKSSIRYEPLPQDDPQVRQPDISKARELLGWTPEFALGTGLSKTIQYFRDRLENGGQ